MEKVFCCACKHRGTARWAFGKAPDFDGCRHPDNRIDTAWAPKSREARSASEINANNDCPWFEQQSETQPKPPIRDPVKKMK